MSEVTEFYQYKKLNDLDVYFHGKFEDDELLAYTERAKNKFGNKVTAIFCDIDPKEEDFVKLQYDIKKEKFVRLRRITGYLVGDMDRWNNAKRKEESERVKHATDERKDEPNENY